MNWLRRRTGAVPLKPVYEPDFDWMRQLQRDYLRALIAMLPAKSPVLRLAECPLAEQHHALQEFHDDLAADSEQDQDAEVAEAAKFWLQAEPLTALVPLMDRIEKLLQSLTGDYEYEREAVGDMCKTWFEENEVEFATNIGLADAEKRLDAIEADRSPLEVAQVASRLATSLARIDDLTVRIGKVEREPIEMFVANAAALTDKEERLIEVMHEREEQRMADDHPEAETTHVHHWLLGAPDGDVVKGVCKGCEEEREFPADGGATWRVSRSEPATVSR